MGQQAGAVMTTYKAYCQASRLGSIGTKYWIKKHYVVVARDRDDAIDQALRRAQVDGLEHILVDLEEVSDAR